jgi:putative transposase
MPSTHLSLNYHIVFSTKNREPILAASWRADLHAYLGGILRDLGGVAQEVGGVADHVHFLAALKATHCLADVLRDTKTGSSRWIHDTMNIRSFAWQEGYGAVTVSPSDVPRVRRYIACQEEHHRKKTFQEEYREILLESGIPFDERYLW